MEATEKTNQTSQIKVILAFVVLALAFAGITQVPEVREKINAALKPQQRNVLAKITGYFSLDQNQMLILKVKDASGLQIEIYEIDPTSSLQKFKQKFDLSEDADSYVTLDKNSTNLALQDVDQDGNLDIIAPSVDRNGNLRLNTFRFNSDLKMFEPYVAK